jgi:4-amino-4-deoxy-L-arabinose transferase-like glycosyltransferase
MSREAWIAIGVVVAIVAILTFIGAARLLLKVFWMRRHLSDLGTGGKVAFWAATIYTFLPIDLLPDPIYLDDMAVVGAALVYLTRLWRKRHPALPLPHVRRPKPTQAKPAPAKTTPTRTIDANQ